MILDGEICGVEVRMRAGEVTQMNIRCMDENQCLRNMRFGRVKYPI